MISRIIAPALLVIAAAIAGCRRPFVPAVFGTPLDEPCSALNGELAGALDTFVVGPARVSVPKGWSPRYGSPRDLTLTRMDAELNIWLGARFRFPAVPPRNAIRCTMMRGDTTIAVQAVRTGALDYRVDVSWQPVIAGQQFYLQLQTRRVDQLKQLRGIIESVRFPADSSSARR